jgi:hypothetical protein
LKGLAVQHAKCSKHLVAQLTMINRRGVLTITTSGGSAMATRFIYIEVRFIMYVVAGCGHGPASSTKWTL